MISMLVLVLEVSTYAKRGVNVWDSVIMMVLIYGANDCSEISVIVPPFCVFLVPVSNIDANSYLAEFLWPQLPTSKKLNTKHMAENPEHRDLFSYACIWK